VIGSRRPIVLCYHGVSDRWPDALAIGAPTIARQLRSLRARGFRPATAEQTLSEGRLLHVTFDDGYRSVLGVLPTLERLRIPATLFICTGVADDGARLVLPELTPRARGHEEELSTMDWSTLRELAQRGFEIGSHTVTHPDLRQLSSPDLDRELRVSRQQIAEQIGRDCKFLAYPYGFHDARVRAAARAAGYTAAFALRDGHRDDAYAQPRTDVYRRDGVVGVTLKTSPLRIPATLALRRFGSGKN
jgi:peptidoglycan/xylan/chitin deacetylase (PgdA/CDA1 family)